MTALTPREIMIKQSDASVGKAEGSIGKLFVLGMLAGAFIALGAQASLMASFNLTSDPTTFGIGKVVMGAVFPVGLMMAEPAMPSPRKQIRNYSAAASVSRNAAP